jgi:hypothetical protein
MKSRDSGTVLRNASMFIDPKTNLKIIKDARFPHTPAYKEKMERKV